MPHWLLIGNNFAPTHFRGETLNKSLTWTSLTLCVTLFFSSAFHPLNHRTVDVWGQGLYKQLDRCSVRSCEPAADWMKCTRRLNLKRRLRSVLHFVNEDGLSLSLTRAIVLPDSTLGTKPFKKIRFLNLTFSDWFLISWSHLIRIIRLIALSVYTLKNDSEVWILHNASTIDAREC